MYETTNHNRMDMALDLSKHIVCSHAILVMAVYHIACLISLFNFYEQTLCFFSMAFNVILMQHILYTNVCILEGNVIVVNYLHFFISYDNNIQWLFEVEYHQEGSNLIKNTFSDP